MSAYSDKLKEICAWINANPGTGGARGLTKIVNDLEGDGPIAELLHTLDRDLFTEVIELLVEFRNTGRREGYNRLHAEARRSINPADLASGDD